MNRYLGVTIRYEALLALRHRVVWWSLLPLCALTMALGNFPHGRKGFDGVAAIGDAALLINFLGSIGIAIALADRLAVQRRPGLRELLDATPGGGSTRTVGIMLGPWLIASIPGALILLVMGVWLTITAGNPGPLAAAAIGLVTIVLPGSLLLTALANIAGLLLPSVVVRVLIVPFWYWATALTPLVPIPTVAWTVLSPLGDYQAAQWLDVVLRQPDDGPLQPGVSLASATASLAITLAATVLALLIGHLVLTKTRCAGSELG